MRVLTQGVDLTRTLRKLMRRYKRYRWAVAWASVECPLYVQLRKHPERISQMVVGTHFYQTHPGFLEAFARHRKVRFVLHTDGVFHPKVYLFENDADNWACIVGSPNFTGAAFSKNVETAVLFDSTGEESRRIYSRLSRGGVKPATGGRVKTGQLG